MGLWAVLLHGVWEYAQVIPLYRCWERWSLWQRIWILPAATMGDAAATVILTAVTAAVLGPAHVQSLRMEGGRFLLGTGFVAGIIFESSARRLDLWRYKEPMTMIRVAGLHVGLAPVLQMTLLPALAVGIAA